MVVYCVSCEVKTKRVYSNFTTGNNKIIMRNLPAYKCHKCGRITFDINEVIKAKDEVRKILEERQPAMEFDRTLSHDGKSLTMRIPKQIEHALGLKRGARVILRVENKKRVALIVAAMIYT